MSKKETHIHKYVRAKLGKHVIFKCAIIGCPHHLSKELVVGRVSVCWKCEQPFAMTKASILLARPHCIPCTVKKTEPVVDHDLIKEFLENIEN